MSAYKVIECDIKNEEYIIAGLIDMGFPREQIEVHPSPVPLAGYTGRLGRQKANIIVRRNHFKKATKARYNADLGFEKVGDGYKTHINSEESGWWKSKEPRFKQVAATLHVTAQAKKRGYHVTKVKTGDVVKLKLTKNY